MADPLMDEFQAAPRPRRRWRWFALPVLVLVLAASAAAADPVLRVVSQDATTITLGWDPVSGAEGFRFSSSATSKRSHTWDGSRTTVRFAKTDSYMVERIDTTVVGVYPGPPAPPAGSAPWLGSFNASYQGAKPGDTVVVPAGTYPSDTIRPRAVACCVTFEMGGAVNVNGTLRIEGQNIRIVGAGQMKVTYLLVWGGTGITASGIDGTHFDIFETPGPVAILNGDWGPCQAPRDDPSCLSRIGSGSNVLLEGNTFHNITSTNLGQYHVDGMAVFGGANNVVRRNRFYGNMITNIRVQNCCGNPPLQNLTIEGNSFEAAVAGDGVSKNGNGIDIDSNVPGLKIRFNSLEQQTYIGFNANQSSGEVTGNAYSHVSCMAGLTYSFNVFKPWSDNQGHSPCSATDTKVTSLGYGVFPALLPTSPAIDRGGTGCPSFDLVGSQRPQGSACDAGAIEAR